MKRVVTATLALAVVLLMAPGHASAQISIGIGGGASFPVGSGEDYGAYAETGWIGSVGVTVPVGENGLAVGASGFYGSNGHKNEPGFPEFDNDKTNLYGGVGVVQYGFATGGSITPYVLGALGFMTHSYKTDAPTASPAESGDDSATGLAFGGAAGIAFPLGGIGGRVQGTYLQGSGDVKGTKLFAVGAGVSIPVGS